MTREEAAPIFNASIAHLAPIWDAEVQWPKFRLRQRVYATAMDLPEIMASSCRAVVFKGSRVVVVRQKHGGAHINPGGRREPGETLEETTRREVLEECGWRLGPLKPLGFHHFQHLGEKPADFASPWCDFIQPIFLADGVGYHRGAMDRSQIEAGASLVAVGRALRDLPPNETVLLRAAVAARRTRP